MADSDHLECGLTPEEFNAEGPAPKKAKAKKKAEPKKEEE